MPSVLKIRLTSAEVRMSKLLISPCCSILLLTSFCFLQINQQKRVGMVSTDNANTLNRSKNLFSRNHLTLHFRLRREGRQLPITEQLLYQTEKSSHCRFSIKTLFLKNLQYSRENTYEIFKITYFEEHLCTTTSSLTVTTQKASACSPRTSC